MIWIPLTFSWLDFFMIRHLQLRMTWNYLNLSCGISQKIFKELGQSSKSYGRDRFFTSVRCKAAGFNCVRQNVLHVGNVKTTYICLSNVHSMPKPGRQMFFNVLHGVLVYSPKPNLSWMGPRTKGFTGTTPWNVLCLYLWSSFYRWIGLCKQMAATSDCCVGFLVSFSWVECSSPGMWPKLSESWDLCPSVLLGLFLGVILQYIPIAWMSWMDLTAWWVVIFHRQCWVS